MSRADKILEELGGESKERFERVRAVLTFREYLELLLERPYRLTRNVAQYTADMMDHFGTYEVPDIGEPIRRFRVFDDEPGGGLNKVVGQEIVQNELYRCLREFVQRRQLDRMLLLHGPNGSSKTTIVTALMKGLEAYSQVDEGVMLRFHWVFSESDEKGESLGFNPVRADEDLDSFAHLDAERVSAKIPCDMNENPIFLIPRKKRLSLLEDALTQAPASEREAFVETRFLVEGDLSPKSRRIYESLLTAYQGDWRVIRHVQVERFRVSKRYRSGAVTIEPQGNMDASARQIGHATMNGLPPVLQNESLFEAVGDLIDANGGIVEYSDFFKRPIEANKYLLTTAENGILNLPHFSALMNLLLVGTSNENYLSAFRQDPVFSSFKARLELVRVPYLLRFHQEAEIYQRQIEKLAESIHVAPHTAETAALWVIMTRLMEPVTDLPDKKLQAIVETLRPLDKARIYDSGELPRGLNNEERKLLRAHIPVMRHEYNNAVSEFEGSWDSAYEGRRGCSAREMSTLLSEIAVNPPGDCLTPLGVLRALPALMKEATIYEFLRMKPTRNRFHDCAEFLRQAEEHLTRLVRADVLHSADLVEVGEYGRLLTKYVAHMKASATKEKVKDKKSGQSIPPDREFMERIEKLLDVREDAESFRQGLMTQIASYRLENPDEDIVAEIVFSDLRQTLEENVFIDRLATVRQTVINVLVLEGARAGTLSDEAREEALRFEERMCGELGYIPYSMIEMLQFFLDGLEDS